MNAKIDSTRKLLVLARSPANMGALIRNESLISALGRVLREDGRKSMELVTNILYIFFCFSNFSEFHSHLIANKIGDICFRIADQEIKRFEYLKGEMAKKKAATRGILINSR
jgi:hypothetical protein